MRMYPSYTSIYHAIPSYDGICEYMSGYQGVRIPDEGPRDSNPLLAQPWPGPGPGPGATSSKSDVDDPSPAGLGRHGAVTRKSRWPLTQTVTPSQPGR